MTAKNDDYYHLGLTDSEVLQSREKNGVNLLTPPKRPSLWKLYLEKFEDPVVRVLLVAAVFSLIISIIENEYAETIGIIAAILLATGIGFFFEYDANKKFYVNEKSRAFIKSAELQLPINLINALSTSYDKQCLTKSQVEQDLSKSKSYGSETQLDEVKEDVEEYEMDIAEDRW